jgi:hypothetical protein
MSDWRTVKSLATDRDDCGLCKHSAVEHETGFLLCKHQDTPAIFGRPRVAAWVARFDMCHGDLWRPAGNTSKTRQNGVKTGDRTKLASEVIRDDGNAL